MSLDMTVELLRHLLMTALLLSAPVLLAGTLISLVLGLLQTLAGIQEQTLTTVPRLLIVCAALLVALPWFARHAAAYTLELWSDLHRFTA